MFTLLKARKSSILKIVIISIVSSALSIYMNYVLQMSVDYIMLGSMKFSVLMLNIIFMSLAIFFCDQFFEEYIISREKLELSSIHRKRLLFNSPLKFRNRILMYSLGGRTNLDRNLIDMVSLDADNLYTIVYYGLEIILFSIYLYIAVTYKILLVILILVPFALITYFISKRTDVLNDEISSLSGQKDSIFLNSINNIDWIYYNGLESVSKNVYSKNLNTILKKEKKVLFFEAVLTLLRETLNIIIVLLVPLYSGYLLLQGDISPGGFLISTNIYSRFLLPTCLSILEMIKSKSENASKMNEIKTVTDLVKKKKRYKFIDSDEDLLYAVGEGVFSYIDGTTISFPDMKFNKNGLYIFKGSSGSGKSTILNVLYNAYDMGEWSSQINTHISKTDDFTKIAAISLKDGVFLGNSIEEVLNTRDKEKLRAILSSMAMPELEKIYDREDFKSLSGGERDLLLIIRALASDPLLVFLDEPGASLDAKNKEKLFEFIKKDSKKRTYVLAYHDNYLDEYADKFYIVKDASVKESQNEDDI